MIKRDTTKTKQLELKNQFQIEYLDPKQLIMYPNNTKIHPPEQIAKLSGIIKNFDFDVPIVVDENNEVLKGHGRLQAALKLGLETVPVIKREGLTNSQKKALRINDNRISESPWDEEILGIEIESLKEEDFNLSLLGFDDLEIDNLLKKIQDVNTLDDLEELINYEKEEEEMEETPEPPTTSVTNFNTDLVTFSCYMKKDNRDKLLEAINLIKTRYNYEQVEDSLVKISELIIDAES